MIFLFPRWRAKDWALLRTVEELKADDRARRYAA